MNHACVTRLGAAVRFGLPGTGIAVRLVSYAATIALLIFACSAHAQTTTWTNGAGTSLWGDTGNWSSGVPTALTEQAIFPNPVPVDSSVISLGGVNRIAKRLVLDIGGYTFTNGDIELIDGIITANSGNSTFQASVSGAIGFGKFGVGVVNLQGNNTYAGLSTTIGAGFLDVSGFDERLPDDTIVSIASGGTLRFFTGTGTETVGSLADGGAVVGGRTIIFANPNAGGTNLRIGDNDRDDSFSGNIIEGFGGTGRLTKIGFGTQTLTGNNTYSLGTTVTRGQLVVDTDSLPASNGVANDVTLEFNQTFDGTYSGVISGIGEVVKTGGGVLTLDQTNTYTGQTRIEEGTLAVTTDANLGAASARVFFKGGTLATSGTNFSPRAFVTTATGDARIEVDGFLRLSGPGISGEGDLIKTGSGLLSLPINNTYSGATQILGGTLDIAFGLGSDNRLPDGTAVTISSGAALNLSQGITETIGSLSGSGSMLFSHNAGAHLRVGADNTDTTFSGNIGRFNGGDGQLTKIGTGTLTLSGDNTYTGGTTIDGGTLLSNNITGSATGIGAITVNDGGTLGGTGFVAGMTTVMTGGTIAPGVSPGLLTVEDIVFSTGSSLNIEIGGLVAGSEFDVLEVGASATLGGALNIDLLDLGNGLFAPSLGNSFEIVIANSLSGAFDSILGVQLGGGLMFDIVYGASNVTLEVILAGDFDADGDVDGADFLAWQRNPSIGVLSDWQANFGMTAPLSATSSIAIPEPGSVLLLAMSGGLLILGQRPFSTTSDNDAHGI